MHKEASRAEIAESLGLPLDLTTFHDSFHDSAEDEALTNVDLMSEGDELDF